MAVLAGVAGGHDRQRIGPEAVLVEAPRRDEGRELEWLRARASEGELLGIADGRHWRTVGCDDRDGTPMDGLDATRPA